VAFVGNTFPGDGDRTRLVDWIRKRYPQAFLGRAYGEEMARIYTAARIVFNCPIRDDVNMRVFEAAACGSLLLTRDLAANGQGLLFSTGEHLAVYRDDAELAERIAYYLRNGEERERIADAGMRHAHACHTYRHRMADLLAAALEGARLDGKYPVAQGEPRAPRPASSIPISGPARPYPCPAVPSNGIAGEPTAISRPSSASSPVVSIEVPAAGRPLVSIIIPTFNHRALTEQCVASIRGATTVPHEILIVDNGSTDGTAAWARGQGLRVIANGENRGFPAACNQGIRAAEGQYFLLLNNDTVVSAGWLERLLAHAAGCPDAGLVGPATNFASNCQQIEVSYTTQEGFLAFAERLAKEREGQAEEVEFLVGLCLLIPRVVVEHVGLLDERFGLGNYEDNDYSLRIRIGGYRLLWARDVFIHHEGHQSFRRLGREEFDTLLATNRRRYQDKWNLERYAPRRAREESLPAQGPGPGPSGEAWRLLGAGDYPRAYAAFERLVLGQPGEPQNLLGLGLAAEGRGVPEAAAMAYRGVLAMAPGNEDACRGLARVTEGGVCAEMATRAG
jgi:GT2 family glycosyltransferase